MNGLFVVYILKRRRESDILSLPFPPIYQDMSEDPLPNTAPQSSVEQIDTEQPDTQDGTGGTPPEVPTNVTSPMSTDSTVCGRSHDKILALLCSESEAESTDKERDC